MSDTIVNKNDYLYKLACQPCEELRKRDVQLAGADKFPLLTVVLFAGGLIILGNILAKNEEKK